MLRLGSIRGTTIAVDFSFLILIGLFIVTNYNPQAGVERALLWAPVLFVSVLIHELAHAAVIGLFGYGPSEILLGGIGGATMNRRKAKHWHDVLISLAGPFASFALAFVLSILFMRIPFLYTDKMMTVFVPLLISMNLFWALFNLLPIPPLDGGHALRNFLRIFLEERKAFPISAWIAIVVGILVVAYALITKQSMILVALIGWYVFINYQQWQYFRDHGTSGE